MWREGGGRNLLEDEREKTGPETEIDVYRLNCPVGLNCHTCPHKSSVGREAEWGGGREQTYPNRRVQRLVWTTATGSLPRCI